METSFQKTFRIINKDVIIEIIKFLDYRDVIRFCASQKSKLYYICQSNEDIIWRFLLERDFFVDPTTVPNGKAKISYIKLAQGQQIWTFGGGKFGKLGHGNEKNVSVPKEIEEFNNIVQVSCGTSHTAMIDSERQIWTYGRGNLGQLGHGDDIYTQFEPTPIEGFNDIVQVSCGESHTAMIDSKKQIWTFGHGGKFGSEGQLGHGNDNDVLIPTLIKGFNNIIQVSCGERHTAMIDSKNQIWTFGDGKDGQLGHGNTDKVLIPTLLKGFNNIVQVSCGAFHTAMTDSTGQIWTFGARFSGQLGHGNTDNEYIPKAIKGFNDIVQVSCGDGYTAIIDSTGQVWTFGNGAFGRLGHGNEENVLIPKAIEGFNNIVQVFCGENHTAMIDSTGQVWTFGYGLFGQLGHPNLQSTFISTPKAIEGFNDIVQISCGGNYTAITTSN